jgi:prepilin-type N-terminal cleavage/methylation domain-containing protein
MKMKKNNYSKAFSLIELSIAILIIGILITGVAQGSKLYYKMKLNAAQALTKSSPVSGIKDLLLWYETSLESSFLDSERIEGAAVSSWLNNNLQKTFKKKATSANPPLSTRPIFKESAINDLPALYFDGGDQMYFDGSDLEGARGYTVFAVEHRDADETAGGFLGFASPTTTTNPQFCLGYFNDWYIYYCRYSSPTAYGPTWFNYTFSGDSTFKSPGISTLSFSDRDGIKFWRNGGESPDRASPSYTGVIQRVSSSIAVIGSLVTEQKTNTGYT